MAIDSMKDLFRSLLNAITHRDVMAILDAIGDSPDNTLETPFGGFGFQWHPFGNNPSNISTVGLGTKPGRSLTERLTNAFDALLYIRA